MINSEGTLHEFDFKLDKPAIGLISHEKSTGILYARNWLTSTQYIDSSVISAVRDARSLIKKNSNHIDDVSIKNIWLEIEDICQQWRIEANIEVKEGQQLLPFVPKVFAGQTFIFELAKDSDLFFYLRSPGDKRTSTEVMRRVDDLFVKYGDKILLAIAILYEHHIGRIKDLMNSYSSLLQLEFNDLAPDAIRGKKVALAAKKDMKLFMVHRKRKLLNGANTSKRLIGYIVRINR
ncbi:hypothetical protein [Hahella ganghwensis]|uniref:hypothetical protein n=1 Tax=Hahella ganghwensis TaxID=286420 RepID=UPI0003612B44|nr:hypothetical protein [Hahella ganghwensis]